MMEATPYREATGSARDGRDCVSAGTSMRNERSNHSAHQLINSMATQIATKKRKTAKPQHDEFDGDYFSAA